MTVWSQVRRPNHYTAEPPVCRYGLCVCTLHRHPRHKHHLHAHLQCRDDEQAAYLPRGDPARLHVWSDVGHRWHWLVYCQWHAVTAHQLSNHYVRESLSLFLCNTSCNDSDMPCSVVVGWYSLHSSSYCYSYSLPSPLLSERRKYCDAVCVSATLRIALIC